MNSRAKARLQVDGCLVPVLLRRNLRAQRLILRLNKDGDGVIVTLPNGVSRATGLSWAEKQVSWIAARIAALPRRKVFVHGAVIPFEGSDHIIRHLPKARRGVWREDNEIRVSGQSEHLARRVRVWLRSEAQSRVLEKTTKVARMTAIV